MLMLCLRHNAMFFFTLHKTTNGQLRNMAIISSLFLQYSHICHYRSYCTYRIIADNHKCM